MGCDVQSAGQKDKRSELQDRERLISEGLLGKAGAPAKLSLSAFLGPLEVPLLDIVSVIDLPGFPGSCVSFAG